MSVLNDENIEKEEVMKLSVKNSRALKTRTQYVLVGSDFSQQ